VPACKQERQQFPIADRLIQHRTSHNLERFLAIENRHRDPKERRGLERFRWSMIEKFDVRKSAIRTGATLALNCEQ
jgi:hypothetical protein